MAGRGVPGGDWKKLRYGLGILALPLFLWILMAFCFACIFFSCLLLAWCVVNVLFVVVCGIMKLLEIYSTVTMTSTCS